MRYQIQDQDRRRFLKNSAYLGTGLLIGVTASGCNQQVPNNASLNNGFQPSIWLSIGEDDQLRIVISKVEMGQGISTALSMLVAEELDADWSKVNIIRADASSIYGNMATAGSTSVRELWSPLRQAGAAAREMLLAAAASHWGVPTKECYTDTGKIFHSPSNSSISYGEISLAASKQPLPPNPVLKPENQFKIIGQPVQRLDSIEKITGAAVYGIDIEIPGLKYAAIRQAPLFGARVKGFDAASLTSKAGILSVINLGDAIAVVAETYWQAQKAIDTLEVQWDGGDSSLSDDKIQAEYKRLALQDGKVEVESGQPETQNIQKTVEAEYEAAFQAHATMEPMNCTASVNSEGCEIWAPTQNPGYAQSQARNALESGVQKLVRKLKDKLGFQEEAIQLHIPLLGGGFGRRLEQDYVIQAVEISQQSGYPIKLIWSRAEDVQHDFYRPYTYHKLVADIGSQAELLNWRHRIIGPTHGRSVGGAAYSPYRMNYRKIDYHVKKHGVPIGSWRSIGDSHNTFVIESFIDELAHAAQIDPYQYRRNLLKNQPRILAVLDKVAELSNWSKRSNLPANRGVGMAIHSGFDSIVAQVAEVSVNSSTGAVSVHNINCVVDCGLVVNPSIVRSQIEGGIAFGLTATLVSEINIQSGRVKQSNFHDFPLLKFSDMPEVSVHIMKNSGLPGGVGEIGVPPIAPAVCNAVYDAVKIRIRRIPLREGVLNS